MNKKKQLLTLINVTCCSQTVKEINDWTHWRGEVSRKKWAILNRKANKLYTQSVKKKMNFTALNRTIITCGLSFLPLNPKNVSPDLRAVFIVGIAINALTSPLIILLNILVMVAVKTKRQLRTKSNIALACLATSDLLVGLLVQPLHIIHTSFLLSGQGNIFCKLEKVLTIVTGKCLKASFTHLILMSAERYVAVRHPFTYENHVTELRIIIAFGLAWVIAILLSEWRRPQNRHRFCE